MTAPEFIERAPWLPCENAALDKLQVKRRFKVELGKMLQSEPMQTSDCEVPYLKAQHVQWNHVRLDDLPTMWATPSDIEALRVNQGDLLVCEGGEVGRAAFVASPPPKDCIIQNALHLVRAKAGGDVRFLTYVLRHAADQGWFDVLCNRATIAHFTADKFGELWILLPPFAEQGAIAGYLDRETGRLDSLVKAKERWLELLAEKRHALITHAVTRGINPAAPFRDSGFPWLGQVPKHWRVERNAFLFRERDERGCPDLPLLEVSINAGVTLREFSDDQIESVAADFNSYKVARKGDLAFNKMRMWQGAVGIAPADGLVSPDYTVAVPLGELLPDYTELLFRTGEFSAECCRHSHGIVWDRLRLYWDGFRDIRVSVPPLAEQRAIVAHIASATAKLDGLRAATERTIELLKERRAALIAAAVTGKITVPSRAVSDKNGGAHEN